MYEHNVLNTRFIEIRQQHFIVTQEAGPTDCVPSTTFRVAATGPDWGQKTVATRVNHFDLRHSGNLLFPNPDRLMSHLTTFCRAARLLLLRITLHRKSAWQVLSTCSVVTTQLRHEDTVHPLSGTITTRSTQQETWTSGDVTWTSPEKIRPFVLYAFQENIARCLTVKKTLTFDFSRTFCKLVGCFVRWVSLYKRHSLEHIHVALLWPHSATISIHLWTW